MPEDIDIHKLWLLEEGHCMRNQILNLCELKKKDNSVFIWCNADQFVNRYNLKGFYTGMFISEVMEAVFCGLQEFAWPKIVKSPNIQGWCLKLEQCSDHRIR